MSTTPQYGQPAMTILDPQSFAAVRDAIAAAFSAPRAADFLRTVERSSLRIRDFEEVLGKGLLGDAAGAEYSRLDHADQGQIREFYLASLEQVSPDLRSRFFKLYAYY